MNVPIGLLLSIAIKTTNHNNRKKNKNCQLLKMSAGDSDMLSDMVIRPTWFSNTILGMINVFRKAHWVF